MKIGRYKIEESTNETVLFDLQSHKDENSTVYIEWKWPHDKNIKLIILANCETESETLKDILENSLVNSSKITILTKQFNKSYKEMLEEKKYIKLYPAFFGEDDEIVVVNQITGNTTEYLMPHIKIDYQIVEKNLLLSKYKMIKLLIQNVSTDDLDFVAQNLFYTKSRGKRIFPIDKKMFQKNNELEILVNKDETIKLQVVEHMQEMFFLSHNKAR